MQQSPSMGGFGLGMRNGYRVGGSGLGGSFQVSRRSDRLTGSLGQGGFFVGRSYGIFSFFHLFTDLRFYFGGASLKVETSSLQNGERAFSFFAPTPSLAFQLEIFPFFHIAFSTDFVMPLKLSEQITGDDLGVSPLPPFAFAGSLFLIFGSFAEE